MPAKRENRHDGDFPDDYEAPAPSGTKTKQDAAAANELEIPYSPLHDLESVWWMPTDATFNHPILNDDRDKESIAKQRDFARGLFHDVMRRQDILQNPTMFLRKISLLHPLLKAFGYTLGDALWELVDCYRTAGRDPNFDYGQFIPELHDKMVALFEGLLSRIERDERLNVQFGRWETAKELV